MPNQAKMSTMSTTVAVDVYLDKETDFNTRERKYHHSRTGLNNRLVENVGQYITNPTKRSAQHMANSVICARNTITGKLYAYQGKMYTGAIVHCDHKPISAIMEKPLSAAPPRLARMLLALPKYEVNVCQALCEREGF